jgi:mono/diheme cytochrome c family protein
MKLNVAIRLFFLVAWLVTAASLFIAQNAKADEPAQEVALRAQQILKERCYQCHGANNVARKNVFILNRTRLIASQIVIPGDENSLLLKVVESGAMPLDGAQLSSPEKAALRDWIRAGAPSWENEKAKQVTRGFITEAEVLGLIREDLAKSRERSRPFVRYFSITHLFNSGAGEQELETYRVALAKLLNSLSWHKEIAVPMPINPLRTVFRIDLRDYQWTAATWDLILQAYPYGYRTQDGEVIKLLSSSDLPYLRADWFIVNASAPPLYHELLGLPQTLRELERMLGIDTMRNLDEEKNVIRGGLRSSGVSQNNRVLERHVSPYGAYWKSFDFRSNLGAQNIFSNPLHLTPAGGEVIFNLPNGLQAYFLANGAGQRLDAAPIEIVSDRNNPDEPIIQNGRSCMSCHVDGVKTFRDDVRAMVKGTSLSTLDQEHALALYQPQEMLEIFLEKDRQRFREAMSQISSTVAGNPNADPVNFAMRSFQTELSPEQAAAEVGLELPEFQAGVRRSARLTDLGFQQVAVSGGAIKRELWERHFGEVVRELGLGQSVVAQRVFRNQIGRFTQKSAIPNQVSAPPARTNPFNNSPEAILKSAHFLFIKSRTMFLKHHLMASELRKTQSFQALGLEITEDEKKADITIELDRPPFTFIYEYTVINPTTSVLLMKGKMNAFNGDVAAPLIAKEILQRIQEARTTARN